MVRNAVSRHRFLRNALFLSVLVVGGFVSYEALYLAPSFTRLLIEATESDAVRIARHLASSMLVSEATEIGRGSLRAELLPREEIDKVKQGLQLMNLKIFAPSGEVIFSADPGEIGTINTNRYFREIVAQGQVYAKVVAKNGQSLEGRRVSRDVLETYAPLMNDGRFLGVFEVYYDITERKAQLSRLTWQSSALILVFAAGLLIAIVLMVRQEKAAMKRRAQLQGERLRREKLQGVIEMAGAACHEMNQPLQAISAYFNRLVGDLPRDDPPSGDIQEIKDKIDQLGQITRKIMNIAKYETKEYGEGYRIIDIDRASTAAPQESSGGAKEPD